MHFILRKVLLVSTVGICGLVGGPIGASILALAPHHPLSAVALAGDDNGGGRGGDDHGGRDDGGRAGDDRSGPDRNGHDRNADNDGRGDDRHDDDNGTSKDDDSGRGDDDHRRGRNHAEDDHDNGQHKGKDDGKRNGKDDGKRNGDRETQLKVSNHSLNGLLNGSLIAVDNLGRVLEVEVEFEHGRRIVKVEPHGSDLRSKPGPIVTVSIRPAN